MFFITKMSKKDIVFSTMEENIGIYPLAIDHEKIIGITDDDWMPLSVLMNETRIFQIQKYLKS